MKKGFTLIELLAVILILGIIALIAIPIVTNAINESKKESAVISARTYLNELDDLISIRSLDSISSNNIEDGEYDISTFINDIKSSPLDGKIVILNGRVSSMEIHIDTYLVSYDGDNYIVDDYVDNYVIVGNIYDTQFDSTSSRNSFQLGITGKIEKGKTYKLTADVSYEVIEKWDKASDIFMINNQIWESSYGICRKYNVTVGERTCDMDVTLKATKTLDSTNLLVLDTTGIKGTITITNAKLVLVK